MPFQEYKRLKYYQFLNFDSELRHGIFSRRGGVSPYPWKSLNIGGTVGDDTERVLLNRKNIVSALNLSESSIYDCWQVHGTNVIKVDHPRDQASPYEKGDALLTNNADVTLIMRFADCTPILLYDPVKKVVGLVHSGWVGTVNQILKYVVNDMKKYYDSLPENIIAGIGPSIGPDHYEVGAEVVEKVQETFKGSSAEMIEFSNGKYHFDLWSANKYILETCGVRNIEVSGICTACHVDDWFSHRAENGKTGRFGAVISLKG
jgi:polyphenol oxidase